MEKYRVTIKNQLANANGIILYGTIFGCTYYFIAIKELITFSSVDTLSIVMLMFFVAQLIPQLIIHINYYLTNKDDTLLYDPDKKDLIFIHRKKEVKFNLNEIDLLVLNKSFALQKKNAQFLTFDDYNHGIITLQNGTMIIITSLMTGGEFILPIDKEKIQVKTNIFRLASGPSLTLVGTSL